MGFVFKLRILTYIWSLSLDSSVDKQVDQAELLAALKAQGRLVEDLDDVVGEQAYKAGF